MFNRPVLCLRLWVLLLLGSSAVAACGQPSPVVEPAAAPANVLTASTRFYVDPASHATAEAELMKRTRQYRPDDLAAMRLLAAQPVAFWVGDWTPDVTAAVRERIAAARGKTAVLVAYNMVGRDLGLYSAGGAAGAADYEAWIAAFAAGLGDGPAVVVVEPDALPHLTEMAEDSGALRIKLLKHAVTTLTARPNTAVYLDAGNAGWHDAQTTAGLLERAGVAGADGFALNVSNFYTTDTSVAYGQAVLAALGQSGLRSGRNGAGAALGFVVDTSRNGNGPLAVEDDPDAAAKAAREQWCNPPGRAVGLTPRAVPGPAGVDAYLWVKCPGESDGTCRGAPRAGTWWPEYALGLVRNATKAPAGDD